MAWSGFSRTQETGICLAGVLWSWKCHRSEQELPDTTTSLAEGDVTHLCLLRKNDGELFRVCESSAISLEQ